MLQLVGLCAPVEVSLGLDQDVDEVGIAACPRSSRYECAARSGSDLVVVDNVLASQVSGLDAAMRPARSCAAHRARRDRLSGRSA